MSLEEIDLEPRTNILVLAKSASSIEEEVCTDLLVPRTAKDQNVVIVSYKDSVEEYVHMWDDKFPVRPTNFGVITASDMLRSTAQKSFVPLGAESGPIASVVSPTEPIQIGIRISEFFERCGVSMDYSGDRQNVLCFQGLTTFLNLTDQDFAIKFLHTLTSLLKTINAVSHFHLDPQAVDSTTVATIRPLFDRVVGPFDDQSLSNDRVHPEISKQKVNFGDL